MKKINLVFLFSSKNSSLIGVVLMKKNDNDEHFMEIALSLAELAVTNGNEPFGAVLVKDNEVVFTNENQINSLSDPTFHAEHGLIRQFCHVNNIMDLSDYTLYSSCEPCFMCSGSMVWSRLGRLVFSASAKDLGQILGEQSETEPSKIVFSHSVWSPQVTDNILRETGVKLLKKYFATF